jgi:ethanolamine utilization microcompartment shell protein EutS
VWLVALSWWCRSVCGDQALTQHGLGLFDDAISEGKGLPLLASDLALQAAKVHLGIAPRVTHATLGSDVMSYRNIK